MYMENLQSNVLPFIVDALKRYINNKKAWENEELQERVFSPIAEEISKTYMKRMENTDHSSATSYSTDGYSATADTSNLFSTYAPILHYYRKPRTVSDNDKDK